MAAPLRSVVLSLLLGIILWVNLVFGATWPSVIGVKDSSAYRPSKNVETNEIDVYSDEHFAIDNKSIDILDLLNLSRGSFGGVGIVSGLDPGRRAYRFHASFSEARLPTPSPVAAALSATADPGGGVSLVFIMKQQRRSPLATLLSLHSPGRLSPWFQLTSNLRTWRLVLHYRVPSDRKLHVLSFDLAPPLRNPDGVSGWTRLALDIMPSRVKFYQDCRSEQSHPLSGSMGLHVPKDALVYFRQEPGLKKKFLGTMQDAKIIQESLSKRPWPCKDISPSKFSQFKKNDRERWTAHSSRHSSTMQLFFPLPTT